MARALTGKTNRKINFLAEWRQLLASASSILAIFLLSHMKFSSICRVWTFRSVKAKIWVSTEFFSAKMRLVHSTCVARAIVYFSFLLTLPTRLELSLKHAHERHKKLSSFFLCLHFDTRSNFARDDFLWFKQMYEAMKCIACPHKSWDASCSRQMFAFDLKSRISESLSFTSEWNFLKRTCDVTSVDKEE